MTATAATFEIGHLTLTPDFWDCECRRQFIHHSTPDVSGVCPICKARESEQPPSRLNEVTPANMAPAHTH